MKVEHEDVKQEQKNENLKYVTETVVRFLPCSEQQGRVVCEVVLSCCWIIGGSSSG